MSRSFGRGRPFIMLQVDPTASLWVLDAATVTALGTAIIALATIAYVVATAALWKQTRDGLEITRKTFEQSITPILAVEASPLNNPDKQEMTFPLKVRNFGSVPALEIERFAEVVADGLALQVQRHETGFLLIVPHQHIFHTFFLDGDSYQKAIRSARLDFRFGAHYQGVAEKLYKLDFEGVYYPTKKEFITTKSNLTELRKET